MILRTLLALFLLASPALAQCPLTGPQTVNPPNVVSGVDSNCNLTQRQVAYTDLAFPTIVGLATTASNQLTVATGDQIVYLNYDPGFQLGYTVQIISLTDPQAWMVGRISSYNNSGGETQLTVSVTQDQGDSFTDSSWYVQIISSDPTFIPVTGVSLSSLTFGTGAGQISQGGVVSLTTESGLLLNNSHVIVVAIGSPGNYFRGISQYNSSTGALTIYTTDSSGSGNFSAWSLFAQDGPPVNANQIALSQTPVTMAAADLTFTIQAGQNLPIQGPVTITALSATTNQMLGTIKAYSGTSLIVTVPSTGLYGSGNYAAWSILNTGPPQTRISLYQMNGLFAQQSGTSASVCVTAGSVRDYNDTVDLSLSTQTCIDLSSASNVVSTTMPGTISSSGTTVTGASSTFTSSFETSGSPNSMSWTDWINQQAVFTPGTVVHTQPVISTSAASATVTAVASDTSLTSSAALGAGAGTTYYRGGPIFTADITLGLMLARNDSTGANALFGVSSTPSGIPDLPVGYTYYRIIATAGLHNAGAGVYTITITQLMNDVNFTFGVIGILGVVNGGTGGNTFDAHTLVTGRGGSSSLGELLPGSTSGDPVVSNGVSSDPGYGTAGAHGGGTGVSSPTAHSIPQTEGSSAFGLITAATPGNVIIDQGSGSDWASEAISGCCTLTKAGALSLSLAFSKLTADVNLNNTSTFFDGPSMAQGNAGVWWVTGTVTLQDTSSAGNRISCKLWDGTTSTASTQNANVNTTAAFSITLAGILSNMVGNIRISCNEPGATTGKIKANATGIGDDSTIWGIRIQ